VELTVKEFSCWGFADEAWAVDEEESELMREVWQSIPDAGGTNVVDVYVNYRRKKLEASVDGKMKDVVMDGARRGLPAGQAGGGVMARVRTSVSVAFAGAVRCCTGGTNGPGRSENRCGAAKVFATARCLQCRLRWEIDREPGAIERAIREGVARSVCG